MNKPQKLEHPLFGFIDKTNLLKEHGEPLRNKNMDSSKQRTCKTQRARVDARALDAFARNFTYASQICRSSFNARAEQDEQIQEFLKFREVIKACARAA